MNLHLCSNHLLDHQTFEYVDVAGGMSVLLKTLTFLCTAFSDLADTYDLLKLGGSDYHARGGTSESALGSVSLPVVALHEFLKVARPIWCGAIKNTVEQYVNDPTESNLEHILRYTNIKLAKGGVSSVTNNIELVHQCVSQWLTSEEQKNADFVAVKNITCF